MRSKRCSGKEFRFSHIPLGTGQTHLGYESCFSGRIVFLTHDIVYAFYRPLDPTDQHIGRGRGGIVSTGPPADPVRQKNNRADSGVLVTPYIAPKDANPLGLMDTDPSQKVAKKASTIERIKVRVELKVAESSRHFLY